MTGDRPEVPLGIGKPYPERPQTPERETHPYPEDWENTPPRKHSEIHPEALSSVMVGRHFRHIRPKSGEPYAVLDPMPRKNSGKAFRNVSRNR